MVHHLEFLALFFNIFPQSLSLFCTSWCRRAMGLHQAVALCMGHCHSAELVGDSNWFKTVVLSGGTACLPGLAGKYPFYFVIIFIFVLKQKDQLELKVHKTLGDELIKCSNSIFVIVLVQKG